MQSRMMDGSRVRLSDPILGQTAYFNVVAENTKKERIEEFLYGSSAPSPGSSPVPATPAPSPVVSPRAVEQTTRGRPSVKPRR